MISLPHLPLSLYPSLPPPPYSLLRSINDDRMTAFFRNDFTQPRWHQAALKNAFSLLGKQRFHHAAAFFLLGGAVDDAVEVRQEIHRICAKSIYTLSIDIVLNL